MCREDILIRIDYFPLKVHNLSNLLEKKRNGNLSFRVVESYA